jgi:surfeit locus 1 family protein
MMGAKGDGEVFPRRIRWMPLFVAPAFCVLVGLGVWQLERLSWKNELLADIQARLSDDAVTLSDLGAAAVTSSNYRRVRATGKLLHEQSVTLLARTYKKQAGSHFAHEVTYRLLSPYGSSRK